MGRTRILSVVGARPNFMKIAPLARAFGRHAEAFEHCLVHTGQHYDANMSDSFFRELGIPAPDINLGVGSGSHAEQIGRTMIALEQVARERRPDWIVVVGDVNATCAAAITAKKEGVALAHVEAGLRSFDWTMPEEINRMVTDRLADLLFTPDEIADGHLRAEGAGEERIRRVGNIMMDTLEANREAAARLDVAGIVAGNLVAGTGRGGAAAKVGGGGAYGVVTLHRPSNVDGKEALGRMVGCFTEELAREMLLIWTLHPRTRKQLETFGLWDKVAAWEGVAAVGPVGYREMLRLNMGARVMLTDSGGLQEECCVLGTPCITLRTSTERPITLREHGGTCELAGNDVGRIRALFGEMKDMARRPFRPPLWDGKTAERIVEVLGSVDGRKQRR